IFILLWGPSLLIARLFDVLPENGDPMLFPMILAHNFTNLIFVIVFGIMFGSMMADVVEDSEKQTNRRSEGLFFAARSFAGKFVSASGIISAGLIITAVGFDTITTVADFTGDHRVKLAQLFLPAYCSLILGAIACISLYQIDRSTHEQNIRILNDRLLTEPSDGIELEKT
ncbi:MAG: MFS transporter, partial [Pseudomonadales bacterium]|nr:MFS transporter [Pseudomonadales bacterium]